MPEKFDNGASIYSTGSKGGSGKTTVAISTPKPL